MNRISKLISIMYHTPLSNYDGVDYRPIINERLSLNDARLSRSNLNIGEGGMQPCTSKQNQTFKYMLKKYSLLQEHAWSSQIYSMFSYVHGMFLLGLLKTLFLKNYFLHRFKTNLQSDVIQIRAFLMP